MSKTSESPLSIVEDGATGLALSKEHKTILSGCPEVSTLPETAAILRVGVTTLRSWCRAGIIKCKKTGSGYRFAREWICEFLEADSVHHD